MANVITRGFAAKQQPVHRHCAGRESAPLAPIAGVSLEVYVRITRGIAAYRFDRAKLPLVAEAYGVAPQNWAVAEPGWSVLIQYDPAVSARFAELFSM